MKEYNSKLILLFILLIGCYIPLILYFFIFRLYSIIPDVLPPEWLFVISAPLIQIWITVWYLKKIRRSLINLLWLVCPFGLIVLLFLEDRSKDVELGDYGIKKEEIENFTKHQKEMEEKNKRDRGLN